MVRTTEMLAAVANALREGQFAQSVRRALGCGPADELELELCPYGQDTLVLQVRCGPFDEIKDMDYTSFLVSIRPEVV